MKCGILGNDCIENECVRYDNMNRCSLMQKFGEFLYHPMDMMTLASFIKYIEEIGDPYGTHIKV